METLVSETASDVLAVKNATKVFWSEIELNISLKLCTSWFVISIVTTNHNEYFLSYANYSHLISS